ncbi:MAG: nucleoside-triphosphatase [Oceanipulchritudo sp.]
METCILSGPIGSGKTTRLQHWVGEQPSARGIVSPVVEGKRRFRHLPGGSWREMEAEPGERDVLATPRYRFSAAAFRWAEACLQEDVRHQPDWIVLDEIGKLELRGEGFASFLKGILADQAVPHLLLVVRAELLPEVRQQFGMGAVTHWRPGY